MSAPTIDQAVLVAAERPMAVLAACEDRAAEKAKEAKLGAISKRMCRERVLEVVSEAEDLLSVAGQLYEAVAADRYGATRRARGVAADIAVARERIGEA